MNLNPQKILLIGFITILLLVDIGALIAFTFAGSYTTSHRDIQNMQEHLYRVDFLEVALRDAEQHARGLLTTGSAHDARELDSALARAAELKKQILADRELIPVLKKRIGKLDTLSRLRIEEINGLLERSADTLFQQPSKVLSAKAGKELRNLFTHIRENGTTALGEAQIRSSSSGQNALIAFLALTVLTIAILPVGYFFFQKSVKDKVVIEKALDDSETKYKEIFEVAQLGIFQVSLDGKFRMVNPSLPPMLGYDSPEELMKKDFGKDIFMKADDHKLLIKQLQSKGKTSDEAVLWKKKDGKELWVQINVQLAQPASGGISFIDGFVRDATEKKLAELTLEKTLEEQRRLADQQAKILSALPAHIALIDDDGNIVMINESWRKFYVESKGRSVHHDVGDNYVAACETAVDEFADLAKEIANGLRSVLYGEATGYAREYCNRFTGSEQWYRLLVAPLSEERKNGAVVMHLDITARKEAENELRKNEELYHTLTRNFPNGTVALFDYQHKFIIAEGAGLPKMGLSKAMVEGKTLKEVFPLDVVHAVDRHFDSAIEGSAAVNEFRYDDRWFVSYTLPVKNARGGVFAGMWMTQDITELKKADEALEIEMACFQQLFENSPIGIAVLDSDDTTLNVNEAWTGIFGYTKEDVRGKKYNPLITPQEREKEVAELSDIASHKTLGLRETVRKRKDGSLVDVSVTGYPINIGGNVFGIFGIYSDITEKKKSEQALRAGEKRFRSLFEDALTGNFVCTPEGKILACNKAFARIFGFASPEQAMEVNMAALFPTRESYATFIGILKSEKRVENLEQDMRRADGSFVHVLENAVGTFNEHEVLLEVKGYVFDETRRKELEQQLLQSQKMESIGTLAGGMAHDFNNLLGIMLGHSSLLESAGDDPEIVASSTRAISAAVQRGADLVRQIFTFARKSEVVLKPANVNKLVEKVLSRKEVLIPDEIDLVVELDKKLTQMNLDSPQIEEALTNLLVNARSGSKQSVKDRNGEKGSIRIATGKVAASDLPPHITDATEPEYLFLSVTDSGLPLDQAARARAFEPFYLAKEHGRGTGLELAVVYGIAKNHSGYVDAVAEADGGNKFMLFLPIDSMEQIKIDHPAPADLVSAGGSGETILVVEDEESLLNLMTIILTSKGYKVLAAKDGQEGLDIYKKNKETIALVLSDVGLPKLDGAGMFAEMKEVNPAMKMVFASGFLSPSKRSELVMAGAKALIPKPYVPGEVLRKIREVLDTRETVQSV